MKSVFSFFVLIICTCAVNGQLQLAKIFTDNMLLQRDQPIHVWGKGIPGSVVHVVFDKETKTTIVNKDAEWTIRFAKRNASAKPVSLTVKSSSENINIKNILIGDVWLCIGQSNMEFPMIREQHYKDEIKNSTQPLLRLYNPSFVGKNIFGIAYSDSVAKLLNANDFYKGEWQYCDSNSFKNMSAIAYYFGKDVVENIIVPIGLINLSIGGAPLETFINTAVLKNDSQFANKVKGDWIENTSLPVWIRERGRQNVGLLQNVPEDENGKNHAYKPGFAYNAGIAPLFNMPIKGILCYQGESNAQEIERVEEYGRLSALMVIDYRKKWKQPALPFYYVQLSSIDTVKYKGALWPLFRDEQRKMMTLIPNSGMAVCSDIGFKDDVHPNNKKDVGERLAAWALYKTYGKKNIPSGPLVQKAIYKNRELVITFNYAGKGLQTVNGEMLNGFSIDGKTATVALIKNKQVVIKLNEKPESIYYGWKPFCDANLINSDLLPASTFKIKVEVVQ